MEEGEALSRAQSHQLATHLRTIGALGELGVVAAAHQAYQAHGEVGGDDKHGGDVE